MRNFLKQNQQPEICIGLLSFSLKSRRKIKTAHCAQGCLSFWESKCTYFIIKLEKKNLFNQSVLDFADPT